MNSIRVNQMRSETSDQLASDGSVRPAWLAALLFTGVLAMSAASAGEHPAAPVGSVSLVLGKAWVESADGDRRPARTGIEINASDRIITAGTGHVHIRFIDDALVSVRPDSRLRITDYVYDPDSPADSLVRFSLEEGVTRSISGDAGHSARHRFRLDTPIAAIGVRGTDFVVSADSDNMRALVNEGAIVVAPYSDSCLAGGLGPCLDEGVELASASMQMVELAEGQLQPMLRPRVDSRLYAMVDDRLAEDEEDRRASGESTSTDIQNDLPEGYRESVAIREVNEQNSQAGDNERPEPVVVPASLEASALSERQLVWGRFTGQASEPGISLAWADARDTRHVTMGNGEVGLYRLGDATERLDPQMGGAVDFQLTAARAVHEDASGITPVTVRDGDLRIDFTRSTFATGLDLESGITGSVRLDASGALLPDGLFRQRDERGVVAGAVSLDGSEAGYFFDRRIGSGVVRGTTLWGADE